MGSPARRYASWFTARTTAGNIHAGKPSVFSTRDNHAGSFGLREHTAATSVYPGRCDGSSTGHSLFSPAGFLPCRDCRFAAAFSWQSAAGHVCEFGYVAVNGMPQKRHLTVRDLAVRRKPGRGGEGHGMELLLGNRWLLMSNHASSRSGTHSPVFSNTVRKASGMSAQGIASIPYLTYSTDLKSTYILNMSAMIYLAERSDCSTLIVAYRVRTFAFLHVSVPSSFVVF
jgi:hypothetical protein